MLGYLIALSSYQYPCGRTASHSVGRIGRQSKCPANTRRRSEGTPEMTPCYADSLANGLRLANSSASALPEARESIRRPLRLSVEGTGRRSFVLPVYPRATSQTCAVCLANSSANALPEAGVSIRRPLRLSVLKEPAGDRFYPALISHTYRLWIGNVWVVS